MSNLKPYTNKILTITYILLSLQPILVHGKHNCICQTEHKEQNKNKALQYKLAAIASILVASALGICIPLFSRNISALQPNRALHFLIKSFAAGVILATGFIHILPDGFANLTSPCLGENPWGGFPMTGLVSMVSAIGTLMMEAFATGFHRRAELRKALPVTGDDESGVGVVVDGGHAHGGAIILNRSSTSSDLIRYRIISQVLELGIVVHSVIIGISLGATQSSKTIRPLIAALSFHQFFEGMGLGGCISQAKFKIRVMTTMVLFFSLTTPIGIAIGIGISKVYNEYSKTSLIVEGVLNSASAGILIYMALVNLLAADFMNPKLQINVRLQLGCNVTLLMGTYCMSHLAKWGES